MTISFRLNGREMTIEADPDRRVVDLIREELGLTGTKEGCGSGECGACTILVDGENRLACLMLAAQIEGRRVTTIEGLADGERLHPLQESFVRCGAVQCGFCTPGMILSASALLSRKPGPTREEIREGLSGNLCRCTGYQKIVDAVASAAPLLLDPNITFPGAPERDGGPGAAPRRGWQDEKGHEPRREPLLPGDGGPVNPRTARTSVRKVLLPESLPELWSCLAGEPEARVFSGGTDLLAQMRVRQDDPPALICLERIAALQGVREESGRLWIGAGTTHRRLLDDELIRRYTPVLAKALETLGSPPIRTMGTIGGNVCTASPAGDTLPPLYLLEAEVELISADARRLMPIASFIAGPGRTDLRKGEILAGIRVKKPAAGTLQHFEKVGQRKALACAIASMAALLRLSPAGVVEELRIAWGSVGPTVVTAPGIEAFLVGEILTGETCARAVEAARSIVSPIDDLRATADYRRTVSGNLLLRFLHSSLRRR